MAKGKRKKALGGKARKSNKKPLKLLVSFRDKMKKNLPKLERIIEQRRAAGER